VIGFQAEPPHRLRQDLRADRGRSGRRIELDAHERGRALSGIDSRRVRSVRWSPGRE
jgi:hypothetical protein